MRKSKLYKITDIDKLAYRLNEFPGLAKDIFNYLPIEQLRAFLNDKALDNLIDEWFAKLDIVDEIQFDCKNKLKNAKKEANILKNKVRVIEDYINHGYVPGNYKKKYPYLRVLKE